MANDKQSIEQSARAGAVALPKSRRGLKGFFSETGKELKKVVWPTRPEAFRLTSIVLAVCVFMALLLFGLSLASNTLVELVTKGKVN